MKKFVNVIKALFATNKVKIIRTAFLILRRMNGVKYKLL